jgi:lipoprotein-releasing system ATP-binding protein
MNEPVVLQCTSISKSFHQGPEVLAVLQRVDFAVRAGERVAVLGRSGSGKSTLLHILGGLADPDRGEVLVEGQNVGQLGPNARAALRSRRLGFVYQFHHLLPEFSALENVAMPLLLARVTPAESEARAQHMLAAVGLAERATHRPAELSGGERQRVAIARALVADPAVVLADEPTGNLDRETAERVFAVMMELARDSGTAFVVVTHDEGLARRMDRSLLLTDGVLTERR